jgi:DNA-binding SARP family transcriptional activator/tetratricopeptide (TPR) repeat protein
MEFRLLGPVEIVIDQQPTALAAARQEIVLVMLLLQANHVVSVDRLIDGLWADHPPRTAKSQVMITISALRRLLGKDIIVTQPPGYCIQVLAGDIDLNRFNDLASAGAAAAAWQPGEAVRLLRQALGLWRGPAMEGIASEVVRAAATQLNERRMAVWQDCLDLELALGGHVAVTGELAKLVAWYPLNERFRGQLILALYRSGRQADALEAFRAGRDILRAELGLDPGEELRQLEEAILTRNPRIDLPRGGGPGVLAGPASGLAGGSAGGLPAPRQLPRTITGFVGREQILAQITGLLSDSSSAGDPGYPGGAGVAGGPGGQAGAGVEDGAVGPDVPVVVLTGRGGVGKTTLAVRAAHLLRGGFPDGQLFLALGAGARPGTGSLLEYLLRSAGVHPDTIPGDLDSRVGLFRSWLADRRVLVVIDGAEDAAQLSYLLPGTRGCAAIVTSGQRLASVEGAATIDVGPLDGEAAYRLLAAQLGGGRVAADPAAARDLIQLCDGQPLALRIVAAKLASRPHWPLARMVRQLHDEERRLDELDHDGVSVRATLAVAYDSLTADAKRLFRRLSLAGTADFPPWICAPLAETGADQAEDLLHALVAAHLVETRHSSDGMVRYHLHDLVRIYAVEHLAATEPTSERFDSARRMLGCWLYLATLAHCRIYGGDFAVLHGSAARYLLPSDLTDGLLDNPADWLRAERPGLMGAIGQAAELGLDELCWDLAVTAATLFELGFYRDDWYTTHATALAATRAAANHRGEAALLHSLGTRELGTDLTTARDYFTRSLALFDQIADDQGHALALTGLAFTDRLEGNYATALARYQQAVTRFRAAGDLAGEGHTLKNMAQIHADERDYETAEHLLDSALAICRKLGSVRLTAQTLCELADLNLRRGHPAQAADTFGSVLQWMQDTGDIIGQSYALTGLGNARRLLGDFVGAEWALNTALELTLGGDDRLVRARILLALAELDHANDSGILALTRIDQAIKLLRQLRSAKIWHARALELLGRIHHQAGRASIAQHAWQSAIELAGTADPALTSQLAEELASSIQHDGEEIAG